MHPDNCTMPIDRKGHAADKRRKRRKVPQSPPTDEFTSIRDEALGAADRQSYIIADSIKPNRVRI